MSPARVLLTGAGGFTGKYVIESLRSRGHSVHGVESGAAAPSGCSSSRIDILGEAAKLEELIAEFAPTHVLHLAALSHVTDAQPAAHYAVNTIGTENLLRAVRNRAPRVRRVVLASSANLYGNATVSPIGEDAPVQPMNHYGVSKWAMEQLALRWFADLPVLIARPFNYTGVGQSPAFVVPKIVGHFVRREPVLRLGNIDVSRDISDVRAVAEAYARLLECDSGERIVNICSGRAVSLRSIIAALETVSGHRLELQVDPALVRANEIRELTGDARRLQAMVGPLEFPAMATTLEWMYRNG